MTIRNAVQMVDDFHNHVKVLRSAKLERLSGTGENTNLAVHAVVLKQMSKDLEIWVDKPRSLRAHLMIEELAEVVEALSEADELKLLDGLADLLYVLLGTCAIYNLPIQEAFEEVHRSNMTKEKQPDDPSAARVRKKGPNYSPPDLEKVLNEYHRIKGPCTSCGGDHWHPDCPLHIKS
jgi:predicted HAD superfamily Cof-like phosphohydrolase